MFKIPQKASCPFRTAAHLRLSDKRIERGSAAGLKADTKCHAINNQQQDLTCL